MLLLCVPAYLVGGILYPFTTLSAGTNGIFLGLGPYALCVLNAFLGGATEPPPRTRFNALFTVLAFACDSKLNDCPLVFIVPKPTDNTRFLRTISLASRLLFHFF